MTDQIPAAATDGAAPQAQFTVEKIYVKDLSIEEIWNRSEAFNRFRGDAWMQEPCRS